MATYDDPYSTNRYPNPQSNFNAPYDSSQDYDPTGPAYDPYRQPQHNVRFQDNDSAGIDERTRDRPPTPPSKYEDDGLDGPARQRSTRSVGTRSGSLKKNESLQVSVAPVRKHYNGFDHGEFTPVTGTRRGKTPKNLKAYRYDARGSLWTKGSRVRCCGRFFCCTIMIAVLLIASVVLSLALWIKPPAVTIGDVITHNTTGSLSGAEGLTINLSVNISVSNPNYFSVDFKKIKAEIFYPINDVPMGGGEAEDIKFPSDSHTDFTFPFALKYKSSDDPGSKVFVDLGSKCGIGGGAKSDITVKYKITVGIRFLLVVISPVIQNTFSFACPSGLNVGGLISGTTS